MIAVVAIAFLIGFGLWYAQRIYFQPFRWGWTWMSVAVGVEATLIGMAALLHAAMRWGGMGIERALIVSIGVPHFAFALTGIPMVLYQLRKDAEHIEETLAQVNGKG